MKGRIVADMLSLFWRLVITLLCSTSNSLALDESSSSMNGENACPCINPWSELTSSLEVDDCIPLSWDSILKGEICVSRYYGASLCKPWDKGGYGKPECDPKFLDLAPQRLTGQMQCSHRWCFVDPSNCNKTFENSGIVEYPQLHQSYSTCLNVDPRSPSEIKQPLAGRNFKVAFPGDSTSNYTLYTENNGVTRNGSTVAFFNLIREETGGNWEVVNTSESSLAKYDSSYTACVHDVGLGLLDFCIGKW